MKNTNRFNWANLDRTPPNMIDIIVFPNIPQTDALPGCAMPRHNNYSGLAWLI